MRFGTNWATIYNLIYFLCSQWGSIRCKQSVRWRHLSQMKYVSLVRCWKLFIELRNPGILSQVDLKDNWSYKPIAQLPKLRKRRSQKPANEIMHERPEQLRKNSWRLANCFDRRPIWRLFILRANFSKLDWATKKINLATNCCEWTHKDIPKLTLQCYLELCSLTI